MNKYLEEQLKKVKGVCYFDKDGNILDTFTSSMILKKESTKVNYLFTFKETIIDPFINNNHIPLIKMQGFILNQNETSYLINVKGYYYQSTQCPHCLKQVKGNPLCNDCFKYFNKNDVEDITFKGWVNKEDITNIEELKYGC